MSHAPLELRLVAAIESSSPLWLRRLGQVSSTQLYVLVVALYIYVATMWLILWSRILCVQTTIVLTMLSTSVVVVLCIVYICIVLVIIVIWMSGIILRWVVILKRVWWYPAWRICRGGREIVVWAIHEFGGSSMCAICVYLGVISTNALPLALLLHLTPTAFIGIVISPLIALVITARVFDTRAYRRWQYSARGQLGARIIRAYSDGVMWGWWLQEQTRSTGVLISSLL